MGFSFGGILAMKTFLMQRQRIDRVILLSPCITKRALLLSNPQRLATIQLNRLLKAPKVRSFLYRAVQTKANARGLAMFLHIVGKVENYRQLEAKLASMQPSLIEIISQELDEILGANFAPPDRRYETPCHFAMSVHDPVLDFQITLEELRAHFRTIHVTRLAFPYHQPPRPFTFEELNDLFRKNAVEPFLSA
jgi:alpha-beta hydrolase superfamily lysophospholipase